MHADVDLDHGGGLRVKAARETSQITPSSSDDLAIVSLGPRLPRGPERPKRVSCCDKVHSTQPTNQLHTHTCTWMMSTRKLNYELSVGASSSLKLAKNTLVFDCVHTQGNGDGPWSSPSNVHPAVAAGPGSDTRRVFLLAPWQRSQSTTKSRSKAALRSTKTKRSITSVDPLGQPSFLSLAASVHRNVHI